MGQKTLSVLDEESPNCPYNNNREDRIKISNKNFGSDWYIDSGATEHMTKDVSLLKNKRSSVLKKMVIGKNRSIKIQCVGDIKQKIVDKNVLIKDVLYIPELCANILSVSKIIKNDCQVVFNENGCRILNKRCDHQPPVHM